MKSLKYLYLVKIIGTLIFWALPLLIFGNEFFKSIGININTMLPLRLLGWAYIALCVGYWIGYKNVKIGQYNLAPIWAGIFSNGGATLIILFYSFNDLNQIKIIYHQIFLVGSAVFTAYVTTHLVYVVKQLKCGHA